MLKAGYRMIETTGERRTPSAAASLAVLASDSGPREAALAFTEGVRGGWIASDLLVWIDQHLLASAWLALQDPAVVRLRELGLTPVTLPRGDRLADIARRRTAPPIAPLLISARERILVTLRGTINTGQSSFLNAALYAGRVSRARGADGRSTWCAFLTEDMALSDQVLALFAVDALENPADYEYSLSVCGACGAIAFGTENGSRSGCPAHPHGGRESGGLPSMASGTRPILTHS